MLVRFRSRVRASGSDGSGYKAGPGGGIGGTAVLLTSVSVVARGWDYQPLV